MPVLSDDIQLTAPGPGPVRGISAQVVGPPGLATYYYWCVATYPIGVSVVSEPLLVRSAPNPLTTTNYVIISGQTVVGAISYDLLRTNSPTLPSGPANIAVATGLALPNFKDQGGALTAYNVVEPAAPVSEFINLNNRTYAQPTLVISPFPVAVQGIIFPDGTTLNTGGPTGNFPTWTSYTVELIPPNWVITSKANPIAMVVPTAAALTQNLVLTTFPPKSYLLAARVIILAGPNPHDLRLDSLGTLVDVVTNPAGSDSYFGSPFFLVTTPPGFTGFSEIFITAGNSTLAAVSIVILLNSTPAGININTFAPPIKFSVDLLWSVTP